MKEQTLIILKPDILKKGLEYKVFERLQAKGFEVIEMYKTTPSKEALKEHYKEVIAKKGEIIAKRILDYMTSGPVIIAVINGYNAIGEIRKLAGEKTSPQDCTPGTIRYDFSNDSFSLADSQERAVQNSIHCSDSQESANREIELWFKKYMPKEVISKDPYSIVSETLGMQASDLIREIVRESQEKKLLYHGIKKHLFIEEILSQGIKPLTPEGSYGSFWASGLKVFYPLQDSVLFDWSGNKLDDEKIELNIAVTSYEKLSREIGEINLPKYDANFSLVINKLVPNSCFDLLTVLLKHPKAEDIQMQRAYRQMAEKSMVFGITSLLYTQVQGGRHIIKSLETKI